MEKKKRIILIIIAFFIIIIVLILLRNYIDNSNKLYENLNVNQDELNIFYFNVGQEDSTLITINGYNMLIDSGNDQDGYYIVQFLKSQNINKIDYFILTHFDEDHIGRCL